MSDARASLPRWDMDVIYPGIDSDEFQEAYRAHVENVTRLVALFDAHDVNRQDSTTVDEEVVRSFNRVLEQFNAVLQESRTLYAYLSARIATDSRDETVQAALSEYQQVQVQLSLLGTRFTAWMGSLDVESLVEQSALAQDHAYTLRRAQIESAHQMSPEEEVLVSEMDLVAGKAWGKLRGTFTSQLMVDLELAGEPRQVPMSALRNLASDPDREVRRIAYEAEIDAWRRAQVPVAAAMNGIKGQVNLLSKRRKWETPLDATLFQASIDRPTLEAMLGAARESFPDFRRYLHTKARLLEVPVLAWYDIFAPVGSVQREWSFQDAQAFIVRQFATYSDRLSEFARRAFRERWIDAEPRVGKQGGAFCMWIRDDMSRVFANYRPVYGGMSTLAHELGHAYHNLNLAHRTMLQRSTPMTMAETASIFCETVVQHAALAEASVDEQLTILEAELQSKCQVVVDITSRFLFEQRVFERRQERDLSASEFCELMKAAQLETYGDGLDPDLLHPYMWAVKPHYYSVGRSYYNFPYMFGLLFGLGLYACYQSDPEGFKSGYDDLLSSTGMQDAAALGSKFGIDIRSRDFWRSSLDLVRADIDRFELLVDARS